MVTPSLPCSWITFCSTVTPGDFSNRSINVDPSFPGRASALITVRSIKCSTNGRWAVTVTLVKVLAVSFFWACAKVQTSNSQAAKIAVNFMVIRLTWLVKFRLGSVSSVAPAPACGALRRAIFVQIPLVYFRVLFHSVQDKFLFIYCEVDMIGVADQSLFYQIQFYCGFIGHVFLLLIRIIPMLIRIILILI